MIKNVLTHIGGIEAYGIASICLFFAFFVAMLVWALRLNRADLDAIGRIPLNDETPRPTRTNSPTDPAHETDRE